MTGLVLNERYRLDAELGRGGMGVVYRARDLLLERDVAIKVLSGPDLDSEHQAYLLGEARASAQLNHPNIASIYDAGVDNGMPFIVMELVTGGPLDVAQFAPYPGPEPTPEGESSSPARQPSPTLRSTVSIARQICAALEHAHAHGIIHRDLKPENVLLTPEGTAKLVDFGLARSLASRMTVEGAIVGSVYYLAPELALGHDFDGRADLYALGVMLYEMATGRLPFTGADPLAVISQHLHAPVVPPRAKNARLTPALDALIVCLLSKDPAGRPNSAATVLHRLDTPAILDDSAGPIRGLSLLERIERGRLVGRERELRDARALWRKALAGQGQMLLVSGEPGVGKTRLVRELVTQVQVSGGRALIGASYAEGGVPYAPLAQILRTALQSDGRQAVARPSEPLSTRSSRQAAVALPEFILADLVNLAPVLRLQYPDVPPTPPLEDPEAERHRLFDNLVVFFTALSDDAPLLLVLEDVHWADSGTLFLMRHLARHLRQQPVMIAATYREVALDRARPLQEVLLDVERERLATRHKLARLDREQTGQLLAALFDEEITPEFRDGIWRETEGNPFFVEEVCKALVESGKLNYRDGRWHRPSVAELGIPQSLRVAIQARLHILPPTVQDTLRLAAVLGRSFEFAILLQASGLDEEALFEVLEDARRAQFVEAAAGPDAGTHAFVHGLFASTLIEGLRSLEYRRLHGQAAAAIEALYPGDGDRFAALAYHYDQAGQAAKAVDYLLKAGDRARALYAHREAIDHYERALAYQQQVGETEQAARTLMKLGLTHHNAFQFPAARQAYQEGFALWQRAARTGAGRAPSPAPHALRVAVPEPTSLDPGQAWDMDSSAVIQQLFSGLVDLSPELGVTPDVAHSWQVLEGGRRYVFHLRADVTWSDGVPVTAGDFEYAWKRVLDPEGASLMAGLLHDLEGARAYHLGDTADPRRIGVRAEDDHTLVVDLESPASYFPHLLTIDTAYPVPRHVVEARGADWTHVENLVTNGPFRLVAWERGESMLLERDPGYHGPSAGNVQRVRLIFSQGKPAAVLSMYEEDRLETFHSALLSASDWYGARQRHAGDHVSAPALATFSVAFDLTRPPFHDRRVRQAFALATDREILASTALKGTMFPATGGFLPPGMPGHSPGIGLSYDPDAAERLLAQAGYPGGRGLPQLRALLPARPLARSVRDYLETQWRQNLGIPTVWEEVAWSDFHDRLRSQRPHLWLSGWTADYPDPDSFLRSGALSEFPAWLDDHYWRLVSQARRTMAQNERLRIYQQADRLLIQGIPLLPLVYYRFHLLVKPWVKKLPTSSLRPWFWKDTILAPH